MRGSTNGGISDPRITSVRRFYGMANVLTNLAAHELASPDFAGAGRATLSQSALVFHPPKTKRPM
ncbi:hypothetical protein [Xanthomonas fragariae]|uniref:hypothetical protein n=1 Tax=Xanthomonas fragariae TaxID=48664 RepID=UPI0022AB2FA9|nr:hypothetical protein [Xanthomonas fragariae]WAT15775.1 hypothetical protein OZ429_05190 [Xanthomonas fragariae]